MSSTQKWSRCRRHASRSICRHSDSGSTDTCDAREVDPAALATGTVLLGQALARIALGRQDAQPVSDPTGYRRAVRRQREPGDPAAKDRLFELVQVIDLEAGVGLRLPVHPARAPGAADRIGRIEDLVLDRRDLAIDSLGHRKGNDPLLDPVQVDGDAFLLFRLVLFRPVLAHGRLCGGLIRFILGRRRCFLGRLLRKSRIGLQRHRVLGRLGRLLGGCSGLDSNPCGTGTKGEGTSLRSVMA